MSGEKLFGAGQRGVAGNTDHEGLKLVLHRYIIDAIEESGKNLLEGSRQVLRNSSPTKWPNTSRGCTWPFPATRWSAWPKRSSTSSPVSVRWKCCCATRP
jgi:hypothetical protein